MGILGKTVIERYGQGPFECCRIPGVVVTAKDSVLIYYELRNSANDWDAVNIGLRRSTDGGATWSELKLMSGNNPEGLTVNNPVCIATKAGRVHFFFQLDYRQAFHRYSDDDGVTFSEPESISYVFEAYRDEIDWSLYAMGPGHGIEHSDGRLLIPVWIAKGEGNDHWPAVVSVISSDDGGKTFKRGDIIYPDEGMGFASPNETAIAELSDGSVTVNMRNGGTVLNRAVSFSKNGTTDFSHPRFDAALADPKCFGSILSCDKGILFCNCSFMPGETVTADMSERKISAEWKMLKHESAPRLNTVTDGKFRSRSHLMLRLSTDDAKTWHWECELSFLGGYSDIAVNNAGDTIYCFFECDWLEGTSGIPKSLAFTKIDFPNQADR